MKRATADGVVRSAGGVWRRDVKNRGKKAPAPWGDEGEQETCYACCLLAVSVGLRRTKVTGI